MCPRIVRPWRVSRHFFDASWTSIDRAEEVLLLLPSLSKPPSIYSNFFLFNIVILLTNRSPRQSIVECMLNRGKTSVSMDHRLAPPWNLLNRSSQILCHALSHDATTLAPFFDRCSVFVNRLCFQAFLYPWLPGIWSNPCMTVRFTCRWNE